VCRSVVATPGADVVAPVTARIAAAVERSLLAELRRERLGPLALDVARRCGWSAHLVAALTADRYASARRYLVMSRHLHALLDAFARARVGIVVLKGMALAEVLYEDPSLRPMDDIDVLVRRADVTRARDVLESLGHRAAATFADDFRWRAASMFEASSVGATRRVFVDLHWSLTDDKGGPAAARWSDGVFARAESFDAGRTLSPADHLLHACVHLGVNHGLAGLLRLCDVALMTARWRDRIDWEWIAQTAEDAHLCGVVAAALDVARLALAAPVPAWVAQRLQRRGLRQRVLARWFLQRAGAPALPRQDYIVPLLLMDRGRDCARLLVGRLRMIAAARPGRYYPEPCS